MKRKFPLHWQILIGLVLGVLYGVGVSLFSNSSIAVKDFTINWIEPWGKIFVNFLKLIAVPLVLFSLVNGITSLKNVSSLGRIGGRSIMMYLITTVIAVTCGLLVVNFIKPWEALSFETAQDIIKNSLGDVGGKLKDAGKVKEHGPLQFLIDLKRNHSKDSSHRISWPIAP